MKRRCPECNGFVRRHQPKVHLPGTYTECSIRSRPVTVQAVTRAGGNGEGMHDNATRYGEKLR